MDFTSFGGGRLTFFLLTFEPRTLLLFESPFPEVLGFAAPFVGAILRRDFGGDLRGCQKRINPRGIDV